MTTTSEILLQAAEQLEQNLAQAVVVKRGNLWRIRKHDSNELLPQKYHTKESAERALRAIQMHKHGG